MPLENEIRWCYTSASGERTMTPEVLGKILGKIQKSFSAQKRCKRFHFTGISENLK